MPLLFLHQLCYCSMEENGDHYLYVKFSNEHLPLGGSDSNSLLDTDNQPLIPMQVKEQLLSKRIEEFRNAPVLFLFFPPFYFYTSFCFLFSSNFCPPPVASYLYISLYLMRRTALRTKPNGGGSRRGHVSHYTTNDKIAFVI